MSFEQVAVNLPLQVIEEFKRALQLGYWSNGLQLTAKQRRICEKVLLIKPEKMILH